MWSPGCCAPYWYDAVAIVGDLVGGQHLVAHGNSLRALVKHLDGISDAAIAALNIPTGVPLVYELAEDFRPVMPGGRYLDPEAAAEAAAGGREPGTVRSAAGLHRVRCTTSAVMRV